MSHCVNFLLFIMKVIYSVNFMPYEREGYLIVSIEFHDQLNLKFTIKAHQMHIGFCVKFDSSLPDRILQLCRCSFDSQLSPLMSNIGSGFHHRDFSSYSISSLTSTPDTIPDVFYFPKLLHTCVWMCMNFLCVLFVRKSFLFVFFVCRRWKIRAPFPITEHYLLQLPEK